MKPLYKINRNTMVDEFDVDHSKFSLRDEIEYNFKRANKRALAQYYANNLPMLQNIQVPKVAEYNIRDDKNYAWSTIPESKENSNNSPRPSGLRSVTSAGLSGFTQGIAGGTERFLNGITDNYYGNTVDNLFDNAYSNRQQKLQNQAKQFGLDGINNIANSTIDTSSKLLKYYYEALLGKKLL